MNRTILSLVAVSVAGTLLVSSGAVPLFDGPTDRIAHDVELAPSDGPNGEYAYLDDDGELVVDISASNHNLDAEGVNPNGITFIDDVFHVRYNGSEHADVWLTHESDAVTFYARGEPIESQSSSVTLGPNESVAVGLRIDTTDGGGDGFIDDITVHAAVAESGDGSSNTNEDNAVEYDGIHSVAEVTEPDCPRLRIAVSRPNAGERKVAIENLSPCAIVDADLDRMTVDDGITLDGIRFEPTTTGDANLTVAQQTDPLPTRSVVAETGLEPQGYFTLNHSITESTVENVTFRFSANSSTLSRNGIDPDDVRLLRYGTDGWETLNTTRGVGSPNRFHFTAESPGLSTFAVGVRTPQFVPTQASLSPTTIRPDETATVTAVVENRGTSAGQTTVTLTRDGTPIQNQSVSLAPGENTTVRFDSSPADVGEYNYSVNGVPAGTLTVEAAPADDPQHSPTQTPAENTVSTGQPPDETASVSTEAAGFDSLALLGVVTVILAAVGGTAVVRRQRGT